MVMLWTVLAAGPAYAGNCESMVTSGLTKQGEDLVTAFGGVVACDKAVAERTFDDFMKASGDVGTLVGLSMKAVEAEMFVPVWNMIEKVPYTAREEVATGIGAACAEEPKVIAFLQGAYYGLRGVQFDQWKGALAACTDPAVATWIESTVQAPPDKSYDEKYNTMMNAYVTARGAEALGVLQTAAIDAGGKGGPFNPLIDAMEQAARGGGFSDPTPENKVALETAWVEVANGVSPDQAALVADRLFVTGAEEKAASLLPKVYPDRVQSGGGLLYGVASIESCDGEAIVHYAAVDEPAKRWSIVEAVEAPAREFKPKLKCTSTDPWLVLVTGQPIAGVGDLGPWVDDLVKQWEEKGLEVKTKEEKGLTLP